MHKTIRVIAFWQQHHFYVQVLLQSQIQPPQRRFDARRIAIVQNFEVVGVAFDQLQLSLGERGAAAGYCVFNARLVQGNHIHVAFHKDALVLFSDGFFSLKSAVQDSVFYVNLRFRAVDVLRDFFVGRHGAPGECGYFPRQIVDGEHHPAAEKVARAVLAAKPQALEQFLAVAGRAGALQQQVAHIGRIAQAEIADSCLAQAAFFEIRQSDRLAFVGIEQLRLKMLQGKIVDQVQRIGQLLLGHLLGRALHLLNFDIVFAGQPAQGFRVGKLLVFHQEGHRIAALTTAETFENVARGADVERGCFFTVKRAQPNAVHPAFTQVHKFLDHLLDPDGVDNFPDGIGRNHGTKIAKSGRDF